MKLYRKLFLTILMLLCLSFWINPQLVHAKAVNYQALKYGTNQTSMADGYYLRPAQVKVRGNQYYVTMTIRTKKGLSPWPVKVNTVNGQRPLSIVKSRYQGGYDYSYSFLSTLKGRVNSYISIDVPGVYKANHNISFIFDQKQLPKLAATNSKKATTTQTVPVKRPKTSHQKQASSQNQSSAAPATDSSADLAAADRQLALNNEHKAQNQKNERLYYYTLLLGILILIIIATVCALVLHIEHQKVKSKIKK